MQYREILLDLILNQSEEAYNEWLMKQDPLDQVEIFKELKLLAEEGDIPLPEELKHEFEAKLEEYQEAVLDEKVAELKLEMAEDELEKQMAVMDETVLQMRAYVIECIVTNAPNADAMRLLAEKIMEYEKGAGTYDAANWKAIF